VKKVKGMIRNQKDGSIIMNSTKKTDIQKNGALGNLKNDQKNTENIITKSMHYGVQRTQNTLHDGTGQALILVSTLSNAQPKLVI